MNPIQQADPIQPNDRNDKAQKNRGETGLITKRAQKNAMKRGPIFSVTARCGCQIAFGEISN